MKKMLINASQADEVRTALVDGQRLYDFNIESEAAGQKKSNIYKGLVVQVSASLEAAFIDYGTERHGFLPFRDIVPSLLGADGAPRQGQEFILQVEKEERGNKGASLTTFPSIPGRYLVLMPGNPKVGGVSRLVESEEERRDAVEVLSELELPQGMGLIMRTAGVGRSRDELQRDLDYLLQLWQSICQVAEDNEAPSLVYDDSDPVVKILRDYLRKDISEVLIDNEDFYSRAREFMQKLSPEDVERLRLYSEPDPLFVRYQVESQIETAYSRTVSLPSGGQIVFDSTEALWSIDVNSSRNTGGSDIEATALHTNMEASAEIPRQLRLRDIGGLIVIDYIDMVSNSSQRKVEDCLREHAKIDRARVQIGRMSRFGLLEMSRQRLRPSLSDSHQEPCPKCRGIGHLRTIPSQANALLRLIEEESFKEATAKVLVRLPVDVASALINDKKEALQEIERRTGTMVMIFPSKNLDHPDYQIRRIRDAATEDSAESEREFHNAAPLADDDESFLSHSQASVEGGKRSAAAPPAAVRYADVPAVPTPVERRLDDDGNGRRGDGDGGKRGLLAPLFGLFSRKDDQDAVEDERPRGDAGPARRRGRSRHNGDDAGGQGSRRRGGGGRRWRGDNRNQRRRGAASGEEGANADSPRSGGATRGGGRDSRGGSSSQPDSRRRRGGGGGRRHGSQRAGGRSGGGREGNYGGNRESGRSDNREAGRDGSREAGRDGNRYESRFQRDEGPDIPDNIGNR